MPLLVAFTRSTWLPVLVLALLFTCGPAQDLRGSVSVGTPQEPETDIRVLQWGTQYAPQQLQQVQETSQAPASRGGSTGLVIGLLVLTLIYLALSIFVFATREVQSPERVLFRKYLWCWPELPTGRAFCLWNVLFSPVVLLAHAIRIYVGQCFGSYFWRLFWSLFGRCFGRFTDQEFPPTDQSLGQLSGDAANKSGGKMQSSVVWVRAMDFGKPNVQENVSKVEDDNRMCFFQGKIEAKDILQGALGDCWLLSAMACLAEHPGSIESLFNTLEVDPRGKYTVSLYDIRDGQWKAVTIDDWIPCKASPGAKDGVARGQDGIPQTLFARPNGNELWTMLLEKAMAKHCGSYAKIEAGITEWGIVSMTGGKAWRYELEDNGFWSRMDLVSTASASDDDIRSCGFQPMKEKHNHEDFFRLIRHYWRNGAVLCAGGVKAGGEALGLVPKHAFSILQVRVARQSMASDKYFRFIQIRNPWGTGEWTGAWSDKSPLWAQYPWVKERLAFEESDDGSFWMQWEDFCRYWQYIGVVDLSSTVFTLRPPIFPEEDALGPLKACGQGCLWYWCLCEGPRRLFVNHAASADMLDETEYTRTCGVDPTGVYCRLCEHEMVHVEGSNQLIVTPHSP